MNVQDIADWKRYIPEVNEVLLQEYLTFCKNCKKESGEHAHHIFPKSLSRLFKIDEVRDLVNLTITEHLHAHELLYMAMPDPSILKSKMAGAVYRLRTGCKVPQKREDNPNFEKGFLWWWKNQYSQEEYDKKLSEFKKVCSERCTGVGNPMYGKSSVNKGKGYYQWWLERYGEEKAQEMEKKFREKQAKSQKKYYQTHKGTFTGKIHTQETKDKLSKIAKARTKNGHSKKVYCIETGQEWENIRQLAADLDIKESKLYKALSQGEYVQNEQHYKRSSLGKN